MLNQSQLVKSEDDCQPVILQIYGAICTPFTFCVISLSQWGTFKVTTILRNILKQLQESVVMEIIEYSKSLIKPFIVCMQTPVIMVSNLCLI